MNQAPWNARGLYAITDATLLPGEQLFQAVEAAIRGGAVLVQYRDKDASADHRKTRAERLLAICRAHQCPLLINDDLELAAAIGADGVHLGRTDGSLTAARQRLSSAAIIGATCHDSLTFAHQAVAEGASYVAFGSFFPSPTKPQAVAAPIELLTEAKTVIPVPIVAIGGITLARAPDLIGAGADLLAVISDLFAAPDIAAQAAAYRALFTE